ncbi:MAG: hypothetical protein ACJA1A_000144 [Saprospiraceae bacterium]|jgi:hypothetical protein
MKFYEASDFGLRVITAVYVCETNRNLKIRLIPMCHIGESEYFEKVRNYILSCDQVLFEGNKFRSGKINLKNRERLAYKLNLEVQPKFHKQGIKDKFIHADLDEELGLIEWNKLSRLDKIKYNYVYPIWTFFQDRNLTRPKFVKYFMKSNEDLERIYGPLFDEKERIKDFVYKSRDTIVFDKIDRQLERMYDKEFTLGIIYGAGHMKAISNYMKSKHNFKYLNAEFIEVFKT